MFRRVLVALLIAVVVGIMTGASAQLARNAALAGAIEGPGTSDFAARADATGDLSGVLNFQLTLAEDAVVGGGWVLVVQSQNADGVTTVEGIVQGHIVSGTVGKVAGDVSSLQSVQLVIDGGTEVYAGVSGTGTLDGTVTPDVATSFTGNLTLRF